MTTAIILAGGLGTRLRSAVPDVPKPMAPIGERPFLEHQMEYWARQGVGRFILSVGYRCKIIMEHFGDTYRGIPIEYAVENAPLGTGGGFLMAAAGQTEPFLLLNGDTFFEVELADLLAFHRARDSQWTFALFRTNTTGRYMGMETAPDGRVLSLKGAGERGGQLVNGGIYLVNPDVASLSSTSLGEGASLEDDLLPEFMEKGVRMYGLECPGRFVDIGVPEDYYRAENMLAP